MTDKTKFTPDFEVDDHRSINPSMGPKTVLTSCARFYPDLAELHGVRFSALIYYFASWIAPKLKRGEKGETWDPCHVFADAIGVNRLQAHVLMQKAKRLGIIETRRTRNATVVSFVEKRWLEPERMKMPAYFDRDLAEIFGINGAILLAKIASFTLRQSDDRPVDQWAPGLCAGYGWFAKRMPWASVESIRSTLNKLCAMGAVKWDTEGCHFGSRRYTAVGLLAPLTEDESSTDTVRRTYGLDLGPCRKAGVLPSKKRPAAVKPKFKRKRIPALITDEEDEAFLGPAHAAHASSARIERPHNDVLQPEISPASLSSRSTAAARLKKDSPEI